MNRSSDWTGRVRWSFFAICVFFFATATAVSQDAPAPTTAADSIAWPEPTQTARPWTRWWWLGSAVDDANITRLLEEYHKAGLGGVEITCIYGVRGAEDRYLPYLSDKWRDAVRHTLREAKRLDMGVDLPTGSGWRTGGPSVTDADANMDVVIERQSLDAGSEFKKSFGRKRPQALVAYGDNGKTVDLTNTIGNDGQFAWQVPEGKWKLYTVTTRWSRDNVKRAAPGGEGKNINPLSRRALTNYLDYFEKGIGDLPAAGLRAQFHDSYEYEGNWCDDFFDQFERRRGYRLQDHTPELAGEGSGDDVARIKHDYRETVSDLILEELIQPWTDWSHKNGMLSRNQGHGSPGNWLDIYAAVDIPETESFGRLVGGDAGTRQTAEPGAGSPLVFKFASSAAHVAGRPLVSAETATWLDEHFNTSLGEVKEMVDRLLLAGVNHIIYHGTAYSPKDAKWPGWLFYASTQLNPQNPIWRDFPALNEYVTRCQSVLQSTQPDNDILLYWPIHDYWTDYKGLRKDLRVHNARGWLFDTPFGKTAQWLEDNGGSFDYISDRQLETCVIDNDLIRTPAQLNYRALVVPGAKHLPLTTLEKLHQLATEGAYIIFIDALPIGPPGHVNSDTRAAWQAKLASIASAFSDSTSASSYAGGRMTSVGRGRLFVGGLAPALFREFRLETDAANHGLKVLRRSSEGGSVYLVKNATNKRFDGNVRLQGLTDNAVLMDPLTGRVGLAETDPFPWVRLQLNPGQTMIVKMFGEPIGGPFWWYDESVGESHDVEGPWSARFIAGGPELPPATDIDKLESWTTFAAPEGEVFAGTARYTNKFDAPDGPGRYHLDLGKVADSAEVTLNGKQIATLFTSPYQLDVELLDKNELTVDVTNVAANRIRDMDHRQTPWRIFHDINLVSIQYGRFNASNWPIRDAGLLGPVTLQKLQ